MLLIVHMEKNVKDVKIIVIIVPHLKIVVFVKLGMVLNCQIKIIKVARTAL